MANFMDLGPQFLDGVNGLPISRLNIMKAKPFFQGGPHPN
jgi:hypothetical protein